MSEEGDVFDALNDSTEEAGGGDYADWWEPEEAGEQLVGVVVEMHSAPQDWTEPGEVPDDVYTVLSLGRGDQEEGRAYTPKQHAQLKRGFESRNVGLGDLVQLEFTGFEKNDGPGGRMMTYSIGVLTEEEWQELDGSDDIQAVLDSYAGIRGDNTRDEPYTGSSSSGSSSEPASTGADSELGEAAEAVAELVDIQNGSVPLDKAQSILTDVRELDADAEEAAMMAGLEVDDGVVKRA